MHLHKIDHMHQGGIYLSKEYLGELEFDVTKTMKDYEYTRRSVLNMNRILDSARFADMDSETIYQYLLDQMEIVSFSDFLKRYIYGKAEIDIPYADVGNDIYTSIIIDSFNMNSAPASLEKKTIRLPAAVKNWLKQDSAKRSTVFTLGFGLGMTDVEVSEFLTKVLKEQDFQFQDPREVIFWHCYHCGLQYRNAMDYISYYESIDENESVDKNKPVDKKFWDEAKGSLKIYLTNPEKLKEYLIYLKVYHDDLPNTIASEYHKLYERAARAAYQVIHQDYIDKDKSKGKKTDNKKSGVESGEDRMDSQMANPVDIESILCSGIPKNASGNLINISKSVLAKQFQRKRMSRQRISSTLKDSKAIDRFDIITLLFLVYAVTVEPDWPTERYLRYIDEVNEILGKCGMASIYPVNPYESFVLMCLLTEEPLSVYSDIWEFSFTE